MANIGWFAENCDVTATKNKDRVVGLMLSPWDGIGSDVFLLDGGADDYGGRLRAAGTEPQNKMRQIRRSVQVIAYEDDELNLLFLVCVWGGWIR